MPSGALFFGPGAIAATWLGSCPLCRAQGRQRIRCSNSRYCRRKEVAIPDVYGAGPWTLTGRVLLNGEHVTRPALAELLRSYGVRFKTDVTGQISLLVHGDLSGQAVTDSRLELSKKLLKVLDENHHGHHVCVVSSSGLAILMQGASARCFHDHLVDLADRSRPQW